MHDLGTLMAAAAAAVAAALAVAVARRIGGTLQCHEPIHIQFTSNTSSQPKGAALSHPHKEEVCAFCRGQLAHHKVPRHVRFMAEMPMTVTGKAQKFVMRRQRAAWMGLAPLLQGAAALPTPGPGA